MNESRFEILNGELRLVGGVILPQSKPKALNMSIEKWETIVRQLETNPDPVRDNGPLTCALCNLYMQDGCVECPVYERTGYNYCVKTPYMDYQKNLDDKAQLEAAKAEVKFLKSLVPQGE